MRVAHFAKYTFIRIGGVERHVATLTRALASRGIDVTVFSYDPTGTAEPAEIDGVHFEPVPTLLNIASQSIAPSLLSRCRRNARLKPFDLIHQHWPDPFAHFAATFAPGQPAHLVSWHSDIVRQKFIAPFYRNLAKAVLVKPDALIGATQSHITSPQIDSFVSRQNRHVIPYSIDARPFLPNPRTSEAARALRAKYNYRPLVFALGRHVYYKGFDSLLEAMDGVPAILVLGGTGPLTQLLKEKATALRIDVDFVGEIPEPLLPIYYHACNVFCLPSVAQTEAFGLVQVEAMACSKPIVNTSLKNGVNEVAPHGLCALTVSPGDVRALRNALCRLIQDDALAAKLGSAGYRRLIADYSTDSMLEKTIALYEMVIRTRQR